MHRPGFPPRLLLLAGSSLLAALVFTGCGAADKDTAHKMIISVRDQRLLLVRDGKPVKSYKISTSKFGVGDRAGSNCTPLGRLEVSRKIGDNLPAGTVLKQRRPTGEVILPDTPGRDPIVSRILWLRGTEPSNSHAYSRYIYIHGTAEERRLGTPASYGCIRMSGRDVIDLYNHVGVGADVFVISNSLASVQAGAPAQAAATSQATATNQAAVPPQAGSAAQASATPNRVPPNPVPAPTKRRS